MKLRGLLIGAAYLFFKFLTHGIASNAIADSAAINPYRAKWEWWIFLLIVIPSAVLFIVSPADFNRLCIEDNFVEYASALFNFLGGFILVLAALKTKQSQSSHGLITRVGLVAGAAVFVLSGLEELSWFQRFLGVETPALFKANLQNEINLHNFATDKVETVYYFSVFCLLGVLPVFVFSSLGRKIWDPLRVFIPSILFVPFSILIESFNYDTWDAPLTQLAFITTIILGGFLSLQTKLDSQIRSRFITAIGLGIACQVIFLSRGSNFVRIWDVTEYRELLMSSALFVYAIHLTQKIKREAA